MIDWNIIAEVAGGGFGVTILVLIILSLVALDNGAGDTESTGKGARNSGKRNSCEEGKVNVWSI